MDTTLTAKMDTASDSRWARVLAREKAAEGEFWYSVATTGIYCRPSCPSRAANPKNVGLQNSLLEAKATGFRACKRCNVDGLSLDAENAEVVAKACRIIEQRENAPSLAQLANVVVLSPSYFHRLFKSAIGLTPKAYAAGHRADRVRKRRGRRGRRFRRLQLSAPGCLRRACLTAPGRHAALAAGLRLCWRRI